MSPEEQAKSELEKIVRNIRRAEDAAAILKEAQALPENIRCHIALALDDLLRDDTAAFSPHDVLFMEKVADDDKEELSLRASTAAAVAQFVADNKGIAPSLPVKIIADNARADTANPLAAFIKSVREIMALEAATKNDIRDLISTADTQTLLETILAIDKRPEHERVFIAEAIERAFRDIKRDLKNGSADKIRQQGLENTFMKEGGDVTLHLLAFIINTKGDDTAPFPRLLAENISRFRQDSQGKTFIDAFQEAALQADNWPQTQAAEKKLQHAAAQDSLERQREELAKLRPARPVLKKKSP